MSNTTAVVVADSISTDGERITTFEIEFPRFILAEYNTHRVLSKNCSSSRAIPLEKMIENIEANMAMPSYWGKNQAGMSAKEEIETWNIGFAKALWNRAFIRTRSIVKDLQTLGLHKQIVNRLLEPFTMVKMVTTATEWDNFFWLRCHKDADPAMQDLANKMYQARESSVPVELEHGEWHLPYVNFVKRQPMGDFKGYVSYQLGVLGVDQQFLSLEEALKVSVSMCAQVSYRKTDLSLEKAVKIYDMLMIGERQHSSPLEHQATPMSQDTTSTGGWPTGATSYHVQHGFMSGNLAGWVQYRHTIDGNTNYDYKGE